MLGTTFIQAFEWRSQSRKSEQPLMQIPLSELIMPPPIAAFRAITYVCFETNFKR
jgi:hypothetical protein